MSTRSALVGGLGARRAGRGHKERSKNFTELEKRTVLELIARHRDVLRQGRSNNATNKNKALVWSTICSEVNARCGGERPRTPAQVKMWYENYKKKCKMRAGDAGQPPPPPQENAGLLDGMLWQNIHPLEIKEDEVDNMSSPSQKDEDCLPVNMSNGRLSCQSSEDLPSVLEPQVQIIAQSPTHKCQPHPQQVHKIPPQPPEYHKYPAPLNLSHLDCERRREQRPAERRDMPTEEERLYYTAKRQHAISEHEAKMRILTMELRQKEEIFSLQKQLFLIELKLKMDFLEKTCAK